MANIDAPDLKINQIHAGTYGNKAGVKKAMSKDAAADGDIFRFLKIPAGIQISPEDFAAKIITAGGAAGATMKFGYVNVDGSAGGDDDFFLSAQAVDAVGLHRGDRPLESVVLTKEAYLIGTLESAAITSTTKVEVSIDSIFVGHP